MTARSAIMWRGRDESLGNEDLYTSRTQLRKAISHSINHSIMVIICHLCTYHKTRIIAYQIGWHNFLHACKNSKQQTPCMQKFEVAKGSHAPTRVGVGNRRTIHTRRACAPIGPARPDEASMCARVVLPFPLSNSFNKIEIAQLFKLASLLLKQQDGSKVPTFPYMHACVSGAFEIYLKLFGPWSKISNTIQFVVSRISTDQSTIKSIPLGRLWINFHRQLPTCLSIGGENCHQRLSSSKNTICSSVGLSPCSTKKIVQHIL